MPTEEEEYKPSRPVLHFAHATGIPSPSYRKLFERLEDQCTIQTIPLIGHDERFPVMHGWRPLVEQLRESIQQQGGKPVIGMGHSLGGALHFMAAQLYPELYCGLILIEPALTNHRTVLLRWLMRAAGTLSSYEPSIFKLRRSHWDNREEAESSLASKSLYRDFDRQCLHDYFSCGLVEARNGVGLRFSAAVENRIYRTAPMGHHWHYRSPLKVPGVLISSPESTHQKICASRWLIKHHGLHPLNCRGSHMFPLENPGATADAVMDALKIMAFL